MNEPTVRLAAGRRKQRLLLSGVCDVALAEALHSAAIRAAAAGTDVLLDWSRAERLDSSALQILLALEAELASGSRRLQVSRPPDAVARHLEQAGLVDHFPAPKPGRNRAA